MVISVKKGTILRNDHVSDNSPLRFSVFTGAAGNYMNVIYVYNGKVNFPSTLNTVFVLPFLQGII